MKNLRASITDVDSVRLHKMIMSGGEITRHEDNTFVRFWNGQRDRRRKYETSGTCRSRPCSVSVVEERGANGRRRDAFKPIVWPVVRWLWQDGGNCERGRGEKVWETATDVVAVAVARGLSVVQIACIVLCSDHVYFNFIRHGTERRRSSRRRNEAARRAQTDDCSWPWK